MACVDNKGNLTVSAKKILNTITNEAKNPEEIANEADLPLFKIRSSLRDMKSMGFVTEDSNTKYLINERARKLLEKSL